MVRMTFRILMGVAVLIGASSSIALAEPSCTDDDCRIDGSHIEPGSSGSSDPTPSPRPRPRPAYVPCDRGGESLPNEILISDGTDNNAALAGAIGVSIPHPAPPGDHWVFRVCVGAGGVSYLDGAPTLALAGITDARPNQQAALSAAIAIVSLHRPELVTSPPVDSHVVAIPAWFATTPATTTVLTEAATDGPVTVTITATPTHLTVDPGDGSPVLTCTPAPTTAGGGCAHTYDIHGTYSTTARLHYTVDWTSTIGGAGTIVDGAVTSTATELTVRQIQSLIR